MHWAQESGLRRQQDFPYRKMHRERVAGQVPG